MVLPGYATWIRFPEGPTATFGMGWLAEDQDLNVRACRRRRVGELVRTRRGLLWRLRLADLSIRPIETPYR